MQSMSLSLNALMTDLIARIEAGVLPWRQPWTCAGGDPHTPLRADGLAFSGSNAWLLAFASAMAGYSSPYWFTFKQALAIDAPVAKGARAAPALLYKTRIVGEDNGLEDSEQKVLRYLKTYAVFNAEQLTDCPAQYLDVPPADPILREATRNAILDAVPARIELVGQQPCFIPSLDVIRLPIPESFRSVEDFTATKAHELLHWTGAPSRLGREFGKRFGDEAYAFEELVAEIGAAALGLKIGLPPQMLDDHAAYLAHWVKILKARPTALLEASGHAQKAVDHLLAYSQ
jgi:antirestriction protein ArdC